MLYNRTLLFSHSIGNSLHLLTPHSQSIPPLPLSLLATTVYFWRENIYFLTHSHVHRGLGYLSLWALLLWTSWGPGGERISLGALWRVELLGHRVWTGPRQTISQVLESTDLPPAGYECFQHSVTSERSLVLACPLSCVHVSEAPWPYSGLIWPLAWALLIWLPCCPLGWPELPVSQRVGALAPVVGSASGWRHMASALSWTLSPAGPSGSWGSRRLDIPFSCQARWHWNFPPWKRQCVVSPRLPEPGILTESFKGFTGGLLAD